MSDGSAERDPLKVLAVDDNPEGLFALEEFLRAHSFSVITASSGTETLEKAESESPDIILLDVMMPGPNGYEVTKILKTHPTLKYVPLILLTGRDDPEDVVFGLNQGADSYVTKPYNKDELLARIHAAVRMRALYQELRHAHNVQREMQSRFVEKFGFEKIIGRSRIMKDLFELLSKVAASEVPVLISGESGTGKEVVASAIHANGPRRDKPFVVQNCSAFNDNLLESELFGHIKGSFTGAVRDKPGLFEVADGGTFFLDELGEMSPALQVRLLRVLQDGSFMPVGGTKSKHVNVRVIGATHRNLEDMVAKGLFREDLYYRLAVVTVKLPALRERSGDVPLLVQHFLDQFAARSGKQRATISADAMQLLEQFAWPGNIRQLENEIQRALVMLGNDTAILPAHLSPQVSGGAILQVSPSINGDLKLKDALEQLERRMIEAALARTEGNKSEAARQLGVSRSNLISKAQAFGLSEGDGE